MVSFHQSSLLLLLLRHAMAHALTIPTHATSPFKSSYQCFESPPSYQPRTGRPTVPDCKAAINLLPNKGAHLGRFHINGDDDDYRLPFDMAMGSCEVGIDLVDGAGEELSMWGVLSLRASWLIHACVSMGFYGGYTYVHPIAPALARGAML